MTKIDICLEVQANKIPFLQKLQPKKCMHAPIRFLEYVLNFQFYPYFSVDFFHPEFNSIFITSGKESKVTDQNVELYKAEYIKINGTDKIIFEKSTQKLKKQALFPYILKGGHARLSQITFKQAKTSQNRVSKPDKAPNGTTRVLLI